MDELQEKYENILEDFNYVLNLLKERNDEIDKLELVIDDLLNEINKLKNNGK